MLTQQAEPPLVSLPKSMLHATPAAHKSPVEVWAVRQGIQKVALDGQVLQLGQGG